MRIRKNIYPKSLKEVLATGFLWINILLYYYLELFVVIPSFYEKWSPTYNVHCTIVSFMVFSVIANLIATSLIDPSIKGRIQRGKQVLEWKYCEKCEASVPPRSWHCNICKICILRRDHHCYVMSCCVGFDNQKYFLTYLFYQVLTAIYGSYFNIWYIWNSVQPGCMWKAILKIAFPLIGVFYIDWTSYQFHCFVILIILLVGIMATLLLIFYIRLISKGVTLFENKKLKNKDKYNIAILENVKTVLGDKWYLFWLEPWVDSKLPGDGMNWKRKLSVYD